MNSGLERQVVFGGVYFFLPAFGQCESVGLVAAVGQLMWFVNYGSGG